MSYERRRGLEWDNALYEKLVYYVFDNGICDYENKILKVLSCLEIQTLTKHLYPKWGTRKMYRENVKFFIEKYSENIIENCSELKHGFINKVIISPKLKSWYNYKERLIFAMASDTMKTEISKFLEDSNYTLPFQQKKKILNVVHHIEDENYQDWMLTKLNNSLSFNRKEISEGIRSLLQNDSMPITGCNVVKIKKGSVNLISLNSKENELNNPDNLNLEAMDSTFNSSDLQFAKKQKQVCEHSIDNGTSYYPVNMVSEESSINHNNKKMKSLKSNKKNFKKGTIHNKIESIQFESRNDDDEQISLLKKLIILNVIARNNEDLDNFMTCGKRISKKIKQNIIQTIYDKINDFYLGLLDLLIPYRYIIREKTIELNNLFESNRINIRSEFKAVPYFEDSEHMFYEVLDRIQTASNAKNPKAISQTS